MLALPGVMTPADAQTKKPNILIIVADDKGYSDFGCFGSEIRPLIWKGWPGRVDGSPISGNSFRKTLTP